MAKAQAVEIVTERVNVATLKSHHAAILEDGRTVAELAKAYDEAAHSLVGLVQVTDTSWLVTCERIEAEMNLNKTTVAAMMKQTGWASGMVTRAQNAGRVMGLVSPLSFDAMQANRLKSIMFGASSLSAPVAREIGSRANMDAASVIAAVEEAVEGVAKAKVAKDRAAKAKAREEAAKEREPFENLSRALKAVTGPLARIVEFTGEDDAAWTVENVIAWDAITATIATVTAFVADFERKEDLEDDLEDDDEVTGTDD